MLISIRSVNQLIAHEKQRDRLLQAVCENLTSSRGFQGAWIIVADDLSGHIEGAHSGFTDTAFALLMDRFKKGTPPECCSPEQTKQGVMVTEFCISSCLDCPLASSVSENGVLTAELNHGDQRYGYLGVSLRFNSRPERKRFPC